MSVEMATVDGFAQTNPAFFAVCIHWMCTGYETSVRQHERENVPAYMSPVWAMFGLALLTPSAVRKKLPERSNAKLSILLDEHPEWRAVACDAVRGVVDPFWEAVRFGFSTRIFTMVGGRLCATGAVLAPAKKTMAADLRRRAIALGAMIGHVGDELEISTIFGIEVIS